MIERNKRLIIILSVAIVFTYILGLILVLTTNNIDLLPVCGIILALSLLLVINVRSSRNKAYKFKKEYYSKKKEDSSLEYKESQKILWIVFLISIILAILSSLVIF